VALPALEILVELGAERNTKRNEAPALRKQIFGHTKRSSFMDYAQLGPIGKEGNTTANKHVASSIVFVGKTRDGKKLLRQTAPR
jgi:hypothetical protein